MFQGQVWHLGQVYHSLGGVGILLKLGAGHISKFQQTIGQGVEKICVSRKPVHGILESQVGEMMDLLLNSLAQSLRPYGLVARSGAGA